VSQLAVFFIAETVLKLAVFVLLKQFYRWQYCRCWF
jgi:hypothetical protein